jgi:hypothetical protein
LGREGYGGYSKRFFFKKNREKLRLRKLFFEFNIRAKQVADEYKSLKETKPKFFPVRLKIDEEEEMLMELAQRDFTKIPFLNSSVPTIKLWEEYYRINVNRLNDMIDYLEIKKKNKT